VTLACIPIIMVGAAKDNEMGEDMVKGSMTGANIVKNDDAILLSESSINWMTTQSLNGEQMLINR